MADDKILKNGSRGDDVKALQQKLIRLGYDLTADGIYGANTEGAVRSLQKQFGYDIDGIAGKATFALVEQQIGYNWNAKNPPGGNQAVASATKGAPGTNKAPA